MVIAIVEEVTNSMEESGPSRVTAQAWLSMPQGKEAMWYNSGILQVFFLVKYNHLLK